MLGGIFQSPKSLLASSIAQNLATYFDVDASAIESNLVSDTKITLHNTKLKPSSPIAGCLLLGDVEHVEFSWKWGGASDGSTSFVRETMLTISGADFRIVPIGGNTPASVRGTSEAVGANQAGGGSWDYLTRHVDQIVDHLTFNLKDIRLTVDSSLEEDSNSSSVVFEISSLQLMSLGRQNSDLDVDLPPLSQQLSLGLFTAYVMHDGESLPLVDPVSYSLSIQRIAGKRFSGLDEGLIVEGSEGTETFGLHLGKPQLSAVSQLSEAFKSAEFGEAQSGEADSKSCSPTSLCLALPSVVIHLPNTTLVAFPQCRLQVSMDGSKFEISGAEGIEVNGSSVLRPRNGASWLIDVTSSMFVLGSPSFEASNSIARVDMDQNMLKTLVSELDDLFVSTTSMNATSLSTAGCARSFSILLQGRTDFTLKNDLGHWIRASMGSLDVIVDLSERSVKHFELSGFTVGPTSLGRADISVPTIKFDSEQQMFSTQDSVSAECESTSVLSALRDFAQPFGALFSDSGNTTSSASLPFNVQLPGVHLKVCHTTCYTGVIKNLSINATSSVTSVGSVDVHGEDGFELLAEGIAISPSLSVSIDQISTMNIQGICALDRPLNGLSVNVMDDKSATLRFKSAGVFLERKSDTTSPSGDVGFPDFYGVSSVRLTVDESLAVSTRVSDSLVKLNTGHVHASMSRYEGSISFAISDPLDFTLYRDHTLFQGSMSPSTATISLRSFLVENFTSGGITVEHGSSKVTCGKVELIRCSLEFTDPVTARVGSVSDISSLQNELSTEINSGASILSTWEEMKNLPFSSVAFFSIDAELLGLGIGATVENAVLDMKRASSSKEELLGSASLTMQLMKMRMPNQITAGLTQLSTRFDIYTTGNCSVLTQGTTELRLTDSTTQRHLVCSLHPSAVTLTSRGELNKCTFSRLCISKTSFGLESLAASTIVYNALESTVKVRGDVTAAVTTADAFPEVVSLLTSLQSVWDRVRTEFGMGESEALQQASASEIKICCSSPAVVMEFRGLVKELSTIACEKAAITCSSFGQAVFSDLGAQLGVETSTFNVGRIDRCTIPEYGHLMVPVAQTTTMSYNVQDGLVVTLPPVEVMIHGLSKGNTHRKRVSDRSDELELPFPFAFHLEKVTCHSKSRTLGSCSAESVQLDAFSQEENLTGGVGFRVSVGQVTHNMLHAQLFRASGCYSASQKLLSNANIKLGSAVLIVGLEWESLLSDGKPVQKHQQPWQLPHILIEPITTSLCLEGNVLSTSAKIKLPGFAGSSDCAIGDLVNHYSKAVRQRLPLLLTNAKVAGRNVSEAGAQAVGSAILSSTPVGCIAGSVVGVAAVDGIRGALTAGKQARGASSDDSYKFGDFSQGVSQAVKVSARLGASARGADSYEFGDATAGALQAGTAYAKENREKLGATGGSTLGMMVGAAALGPIGLVAGAVAGGMAASKALQKNKASREACQLPPTSVKSTLDVHAPSNQPIDATAHHDLLGLQDDQPWEGVCQAPSNIVDPASPTRQLQATAHANAHSPAVSSLQYGLSNPGTVAIGCQSRPASTGPFIGGATPLPQAHSTPSSLPQNGSHLGPGPNVVSQSKSMKQVTPFDPYSQSVQAQQPASQFLHQAQSSYGHQHLPGTGTPKQFAVPQPPHHRNVQSRGSQQDLRRVTPNNREYQFGDIAKSVVAKGKKGRTGDDKAGYKFGDFTRGLFSK